MKNRSRLALLVILSAAALALVGCAPGGGSDSGSGGSSDGGSVGSSLNCDGFADQGYELFVDPRLTVDPVQEVYSLDSGDSIGFTDVPEDGVYTTYGYTVAYIDDDTVFPSNGGTFVGAENTNTWTLDGPITPVGISGGPYAAFIQIDATTETGTTTLAVLCAILPAS